MPRGRARREMIKLFGVATDLKAGIQDLSFSGQQCRGARIKMRGKMATQAVRPGESVNSGGVRGRMVGISEGAVRIFD